MVDLETMMDTDKMDRYRDRPNQKNKNPSDTTQNTAFYLLVTKPILSGLFDFGNQN